MKHDVKDMLEIAIDNNDSLWEVAVIDRLQGELERLYSQEDKAKAFDAISYIIKKRANDDFSSVNNDYEAGILRAYEVMECNVDDFYRGESDA